MIRVGDWLVFRSDCSNRLNKGMVTQIHEVTDKDGVHQHIVVRTRQYGTIVLDYPYDGVYFKRKVSVWS